MEGTEWVLTEGRVGKTFELVEQARVEPLPSSFRTSTEARKQPRHTSWMLAFQRMF